MATLSKYEKILAFTYRKFPNSLLGKLAKKIMWKKVVIQMNKLDDLIR